MSTYHDPPRWPQPFPPARVLFRLTGPFPGLLVTAPRPCLLTAPPLVLRYRAEFPLTVTVERCVSTAWQPVLLLVEEQGAGLVKHGGWPIRVRIEGTSAGWVDLLDPTP